LGWLHNKMTWVTSYFVNGLTFIKLKRPANKKQQHEETSDRLLTPGTVKLAGLHELHVPHLLQSTYAIHSKAYLRIRTKSIQL
jgi:uncharacterized membrane protein SirB2